MVLILVGSPIWAVYLVQRYLSGKPQPGWAERWGRLPEALVATADSKPRVWMHAVSAGEVVAAVPIVRELRSMLPEFEILFSVTTAAGMEMAEQQARLYVDRLFYFPFDFPWVVRQVVHKIRPRVFVSLESELWPNLLHELKRQGATTVMVNGRITERNFRRARSVGAGLFRWVLSNMDRLLVQSEPDAARIAALGGPQVSLRVEVVGNSKFDQEIANLTVTEARVLRASLKFPVDSPIFVAGSTRSAEEEAEVLQAYLLMRLQVPSLCILIAPRQIDRAGELVEAMRSLGLDPVRKTELQGADIVYHLILDTMGELANSYAVADFAFVGNSFDPVVKGGGQNLLQPLANGKPVIFGPRIATIRSEVALSIEAGVGFQVHNAKELADQGLHLLANDRERASIGKRARDLILSQRGVSRRYAHAVADLAHAAMDKRH
jgi:3-deoxy-D-manno-octulosonic-acid transferase